MKKNIIRIVSLCSVFLLSINAYGAGEIANTLTEIKTIKKQTVQAIDKAHIELERGTPVFTSAIKNNSEVKSAINSLDRRNKQIVETAMKEAQAQSEAKYEAVKQSVQLVNAQLVEYESKIEELGDLGVKIEKEKDQAVLEKAEVEKKSELFSIGFYASLATTAIAVFSFLLNLPTIRLDRKLKRLEIKEKELALKAAVNG